jgi:hypothetical protein
MKTIRLDYQKAFKETRVLHRLTTLAFCAHGSMCGHAIETTRTPMVRATATASAKM